MRTTVQRIPLDICPRECPELFGRHALVKLKLTGLDETTRVWVTDQDGNSVKKATGPIDRRRINFKPVAGRSYFLTFTFRPDADRLKRDNFRIKLSTRGFN